MATRKTIRADLPTGVVTFLLTDVESSTRLWRRHTDAAAIMARQAELIAAAVAGLGGVQPLEQGEGDSTVAAFARPSAALAAAVDAQRALGSEPWPEGARLRVRMAIHTGEAEVRDDRTYGGEAIIRCARIRALARGGQTLVSNATAGLMLDRLPPDVTLVELSPCTLDGFEHPERLYQLRHPDLDATPASLRNAISRRLPVWPTSLVGRERESAELAGLLEHARLVTITGAGGSGKTRLAHAVAADSRERWPDGVAWAELAPLALGNQVVGAVLAACGAQQFVGVSADEVLLLHLARKEMLLVLDNCEHLLGDCAALAEAILRGAPGLTILATSREPLGASGEVTWRIPSLAVPDQPAVGIAHLESSDAVRLFVERAGAARPEFRVDADTRELVVHICRRLDGMPLALELAAARLRSLSLRQLAEGLDDRFRLLTGGARTAIARQRTLLASVEWSHDLLDEEERTLFRRLSIFASSFTLEAAEAVAEDDDLDRLVVLDVLARLVDKSLVQHAGERYRMLETLRQFAVERARAVGELTGLRDRHLAWFQRRSRAWALDQDVGTRAILDEVAAEARDLVTALEWSLGPRQQPAVDLLYPLTAYWSLINVGGQELRPLSAAVLARYEEGSAEWLVALAPVALALFFAGEIGWVPAARRALDTVGNGLDPIVRGHVEHAASFGPASFDLPEGMAGLHRAIDDARAAGIRVVEIAATSTLALVCAERGDCAAARPLLAWLERHLPPDTPLASAVDVIRTIVSAYTGDLGVARRQVAALLDRGTIPGGLAMAASIGLWTDDELLCRRAVEAAEDVPAAGMYVMLREDPPARLALLRGETETARRHIRASLQDESFGHLALWLRCELGEIALALGDPAGAEAELAQVTPYLADTELHYAMVAADLLSAHLDAARGERGRAETHAHAALVRAVNHELALLTVDALETVALLAAEADSMAEAARLLGATEAFRRHAGYVWRHAHQRKAVAALRPRLDAAQLAEGARFTLAEAVAYAQRGRGERGRPSHGWESLTPSELRVIDLVASGLPNREIAAKLFVSLATVKSHLVHVYTKLDLRTRAELAAAATRRAVAAAAAGPMPPGRSAP